MLRFGMENPFLQGPNLYLRGLKKDDLRDEYLQWLNDPEVTQGNSHGRFPNSTAKMEAYFAKISQSNQDLVLAIVRKKDDVHIGNIALQNIDATNRQAEFAILIGDKSSWGKGVGLEAGRLVLQHGFRELNLHRIHCGTFDSNEGMMRLAKALGMREEGRRREAIFKNGRFQDVLLFGILEQEYADAGPT